MRALLAGGLAASLIGCTCLLPAPTTWQECTEANGSLCFGAPAGSPQAHPKPTASKSDPVAKPAKRVAAKTEAPPSARPADKLDPVLVKAKSAIAAQMEDPDSVEFGEMKRALRKNTLGKRIDTICGSVKAKSASGGDTGDMPFLYLVQEDEAYVVDGPHDRMAAAAYRNICN